MGSQKQSRPTPPPCSFFPSMSAAAEISTRVSADAGLSRRSNGQGSVALGFSARVILSEGAMLLGEAVARGECLFHRLRIAYAPLRLLQEEIGEKRFNDALRLIRGISTAR